jgi:hypothetical protein
MTDPGSAPNSYSIPLYLLAITGIGLALIVLSLALYRQRRAWRRARDWTVDRKATELGNATVDNDLHTAEVLDISLNTMEDTWQPNRAPGDTVTKSDEE